jgi:hypothetical protein
VTAAVRGRWKKRRFVRQSIDLLLHPQGWTLMLTASSPTWNISSIQSRNSGSPSLTNDFSFLMYGNAIKE